MLKTDCVAFKLRNPLKLFNFFTMIIWFSNQTNLKHQTSILYWKVISISSI